MGGRVFALLSLIVVIIGFIIKDFIEYLERYVRQDTIELWFSLCDQIIFINFRLDRSDYLNQFLVYKSLILGFKLMVSYVTFFYQQTKNI